MLTGIRQRAWGRLRYKGTPPFFLRVGRTSVRYKGIRCNCVRVVYISRWCRSAPRARVIFSHGGKGREPLAGPMVGFQYISCLLALRLALRLVAASRLLRLVRASRVGVSFPRLVSSSRRRLLVVASCHLVSFHPCVLLVADAVAISSVGRLMSVASRRERLASFLRPVSRFVHRLVSFFALFIVPSCSCLYPWRETRRAGRGVDVLVIMWSGR